jgi:hypothetical protein
MIRPARARRSTRPSTRPLVALVLVVVAATSAAGCDAVFGPEPSPSVRAVASAPASEEPAPTESDEFQTLPPDPGTTGPSLVAAAQALADLDSYRVSITTRNLVPAATSGGVVSMTSTLIQGDQPAARFVMTGADGFAGGRLEAVVIGDEAWLREGSGAWQKSAGGAADFDAAFTTMSPVELVTPFEGLSTRLVVGGTERRNGIRATRLDLDATDGTASDAGLTDGTLQLWRATSGRYLVGLVLDGTWLTDDGSPSHVELKVEVTNVNDAKNRVVAPG